MFHFKSLIWRAWRGGDLKLVSSNEITENKETSKLTQAAACRKLIKYKTVWDSIWSSVKQVSECSQPCNLICVWKRWK